jgi:hypothetical protein
MTDSDISSPAPADKSIVRITAFARLSMRDYQDLSMCNLLIYNTIP